MFVDTLLVRFDPAATRAQAEALAASLGGNVAGHLPLFNTYILEFPSNTTIAGLEAIRRQLEAEPAGAAQRSGRRSQTPIPSPSCLTRATPFQVLAEGIVTVCEVQHLLPREEFPVSVAYDQAKIFQAI